MKILYQCINCSKIIEVPHNQSPKCDKCDGKVFNQLRQRKVDKK